MQIGDTKSLMKGVAALCIAAGVLLVVNFGSYYLGRFGFSLPQKTDGLDQIFYHDLFQSFSAGMVTATMVYFAAKKKNESKSKPAA
jgi:predicted permease